MTDGLRKSERVGLHVGGLTAVATVGLVFYAIVICPSEDSKNVDRQEYERLFKVVSAKQETIAEFRTLRDQVTATRKKIRDFRTRLPNRSNVNNLLGELSKLAEDNSAKVLAVQPGQQVIGDLSACQEIKCRLIGSYYSVCKTISQLKSIDSIVWVSGCKIKLDEASQTLQPVDLDLVLLFAPEETKAGSIKLEEEGV